jgi:hypothetical protein
MKLPIFYVQADLPEGVKHLVTCNAGERLSRGGKLPSELIMGVLLKPSEDFTSGVRPDNFGTNTTFVHFLQQIIGKYGPDTVQLRVDAESISGVGRRPFPIYLCCTKCLPGRRSTRISSPNTKVWEENWKTPVPISRPECSLNSRKAWN